MDQRAASRSCARDQVRIGVARQQRCLEEHHGDRPHRLRAAEPRQHHAGEHRLQREQQQRRHEQGRGEQRGRGPQQPPVLRRGGRIERCHAGVLTGARARKAAC
jgi:hypothetical protein